MRAIYEFEFFKDGEYYVAVPFGLPGATEGFSFEEAVDMAVDYVTVYGQDVLMNGGELPKPSFGNKPQNGGTIVVVAANIALEDIETVSATEAARILGVSNGRVSNMLRDGILEGYRNGNRTRVTTASVNERLKNPRTSGRPKREKELALT